MQFDHIGIFVRDIASGHQKLSALLPIARSSEVFQDPLLLVQVQFLYDATGVCYELVAPFGEGNPIDGVLKSRKNVLNHIAYTTPELDAELERLRADGAFPLGPPRPAVAFGGKRVAFLMTAMNFIIELVEV